MQNPSTSDHPSQNSFSKATVTFTKDASPSKITSEVVIRDDGWVWVEARGNLYPQHQIKRIEPESR